ncbi:MAG: ABC transporter permease subunit [candidate division KSB1 bacterium]|nr:ABC transporter permease subunit [candidate division KSB1 bacterium]MDZ7274703.1 ABC transporter permease subunit [candidate division KSB1 bacterium]MDZ7285528.1 ABC transporter permease subunit [candidate division KSB1 bacterium]MDZ7298560.1 ABC transporter permease subunit [candidate division KSB1 bacterium]MDZ7306588.1 ABC transporter permease subunit [candidate division KSB1 bacterium]
MNLFRIKLVFAKDWMELRRSRQAVLPMLLVPLVFVVLLPVVVVISTGQMAVDPNQAAMLKRLPPVALPAGLNEEQAVLYMMLIIFLGPLFLLIPVMMAGIIAASSFAGEKERKTIEGLLYTPLTDQELVLGKIAVCFIPAVLISWLCFVIYGVVANALAYPFFGRLIFPTASWVAMIFWLAPGLSFLSLALVVAVSQRAAGVWEAQQISALLVLPVIALVISQMQGIFVLTVPLILLVGLVIYVLDVFLYRWLVRRLHRERMVMTLL